MYHISSVVVRSKQEYRWDAMTAMVFDVKCDALRCNSTCYGAAPHHAQQVTHGHSSPLHNPPANTEPGRLASRGEPRAQGS